METIKSYSDLEQSKKLAEILPLDSADMYWFRDDTETPKIYPKNMMKDSVSVTLPCWSLTALLSILPKIYYPVKDHPTYLTLSKPKDKWYVLYWDPTGMQDGEQTLEDNPVDACYRMILKLHELNLL